MGSILFVCIFADRVNLLFGNAILYVVREIKNYYRKKRMALVMFHEDEVIFQEKKNWGIVKLNRPKALNALNLNMVRMLFAGLKQWETLPEIKGVIIKGEGRAFCAGGDIKELLGAVENSSALIKDFFRDEYMLNRQIHLYPKVYVACLDGIVMGGGAGLSIHGAYRIVTERTVFAMPETGIGFFPDVGASYFLSRLPGETGMFLGLTGTRIGAGDMVYLGLGTHYVPSEKIGELENALLNCKLHEAVCREVEPIINEFAKKPPDADLVQYREVIDRCFGKDSVEGIIMALSNEDNPWALKVLEELRKKSPTSLKVTYRLIREGKNLDFDSSLRLEYRLSQRMVRHKDYYEGVYAIVVDKTHTPMWEPNSLEKVSDDFIESFFEPLPDGA